MNTLKGQAKRVNCLDFANSDTIGYIYSNRKDPPVCLIPQYLTHLFQADDNFSNGWRSISGVTSDVPGSKKVG